MENKPNIGNSSNRRKTIDGFTNKRPISSGLKPVPVRTRNLTARPQVAKPNPKQINRKLQTDNLKPVVNPSSTPKPETHPEPLQVANSQPEPAPKAVRRVQQAPQQRSHNKSKRSKLGLALTGVLTLLLVCAIAGAYYWQHSKVDKLQRQLIAMNGKLNSTTIAANSGIQKYLFLYQYGLRIPLPSSIEDLYYIPYATNSSGDSVFSFSTQSLTNSDLACTAEPSTNDSFSYEQTGTSSQVGVNGNPFGLVTITNAAISQSQVGSSTQDVGIFIANLNGFFVYYKAPSAACSSNTELQILTKKQQGDFLAALKRIQTI